MLGIQRVKAAASGLRAVPIQKSAGRLCSRTWQVLHGDVATGGSHVSAPPSPLFLALLQASKPQLSCQILQDKTLTCFPPTLHLPVYPWVQWMPPPSPGTRPPYASSPREALFSHPLLPPWASTRLPYLLTVSTQPPQAALRLAWFFFVGLWSQHSAKLSGACYLLSEWNSPIRSEKAPSLHHHSWLSALPHPLQPQRLPFWTLHAQGPHTCCSLHLWCSSPGARRPGPAISLLECCLKASLLWPTWGKEQACPLFCFA